MTDPNVTPPAPSPAPNAPAGHGINWLPQDADPDTVGFVQNKAWQNPIDAVKGYRSLEQLLGADRAGRTVTIPKDDADADGWAQLRQKLGVPGAPEAYQLKPPEGHDPDFVKAATAQFHAMGLTPKQAQGLVDWYAKTGGDATAAQAAQQEAALKAEHDALAKDWGTGPDAAARREMARRAAVHLGLDEAAIDGIEKTAGFAKTLKALAKVGDMLREAGAEGVSEVGSFSMTPEGAKSRRGQLMADPAWRAKAMNPASAEFAELKKLDQVIAASMQ